MNRSTASIVATLTGLAFAAGGVAPAFAATPDFAAATALVQANSQQRADALGGDATALTDMSATTQRDVATGATFSASAASEEAAVRRTLSAGSPLTAGSERLDVETGTISVELIDKKALGSNTYDLTLREVAEYPYVGEPRENAMGEAYERRVRMQANGQGWTILDNEVPDGDWPLIEGAKSLGVPDATESDDPESATSGGEEPPESSSGMQTTATVSRSGATSYALRYALDYNSNYRDMGDDCTNFISQSLRAGGFQDRNVGAGTERSLWSWWYNSYRIDEWTHSWSVAQFNYRFHQTTSRGRVVDHYWEVALGDIMYADWKGDGVQDHTVIFTGNSETSGLKVSMHTKDRRNVDASWWMALARDTYGSSADFDYLHMNYGKF